MSHSIIKKFTTKEVTVRGIVDSFDVEIMGALCLACSAAALSSTQVEHATQDGSASRDYSHDGVALLDGWASKHASAGANRCHSHPKLRS